MQRYGVGLPYSNPYATLLTMNPLRPLTPEPPPPPEPGVVTFAWKATVTYLLQRYVELEGSGERVLVDATRAPTGEFGTLGFACFR